MIKFLEMKGQSIDKMNYESWQQDLAFFVDITTHLRDPKLKLQGKRKLITELNGDTKHFITKQSLWRPQLSFDKTYLTYWKYIQIILSEQILLKWE